MLSLAAVTIAGELVLRWLEPPVPASSGSIVRRTGEPEKQYQLLPNSTGVLAGAPVSIDSLGCRDREYTARKPPGVVRIVGIGDSLTFGQGVTEPDTYLAPRERPRGAAPAGGSDQLWRLWLQRHRRSAPVRRGRGHPRPDIVTIGYELGDILQNPPLNPDAPAVAQADSGRPRIVERRGLVDSLKSSRVVTFLAYRYSFLLKKFNLRNWDSLYASDSPLWKTLSAKYEGMAKTANAKHVDLLVAIVPELSNLDDRYPFRSVHDRVAALCQSLGIQTVDLLPAFDGQDGPSLWVHPQDRHPNAQGHQIIEGALIEPVTALVNARMHHPTDR